MVKQGGAASSRSSGDGAAQVDIKQNPNRNLFDCRENVFNATWNVRTLYETGKLDIVIQ